MLPGCHPGGLSCTFWCSLAPSFHLLWSLRKLCKNVKTKIICLNPDYSTTFNIYNNNNNNHFSRHSQMYFTILIWNFTQWWEKNAILIYKNKIILWKMCRAAFVVFMWILYSDNINTFLKIMWIQTFILNLNNQKSVTFSSFTLAHSLCFPDYTDHTNHYYYFKYWTCVFSAAPSAPPLLSLSCRVLSSLWV